ncbi:helix-turn-helix domain-containing protein [Microbacterium esteraromaticum]|uniref:helix-turn-helix domain-containing protein n=1 Tax=Microbacterium esteraromaticum TaxID=57043 RepID=UPI003C2F40F0
MNADVTGILEAIGPRLRRLRRERKLTLAAVAERSGLSISGLSRLETGHRQPTLELLIPLARVYGVSLGVLVGAPETGDPRVHLEPRRLRHAGVIIPLTEYPGRVQVFKQVLGPRRVRMSSHRGSAWLYVLAGQLRLLLGDEERLLEPGETARFDPMTRHWFGPADGTTVELLHLFGADSEHPVAL